MTNIYNAQTTYQLVWPTFLNNVISSWSQLFFNKEQASVFFFIDNCNIIPLYHPVEL